MTSHTSEKTKPIDLLARLCYFTDLFVHRRVVVVSDSPAPAEFLSRLNARYICTVSQSPIDEMSGQGRSRGPMEFKTVDYENLQFRDNMFDVAVIANLADVPNPTALLNELRRVVGRRGYVIAASPNPTCESPLCPTSEAGEIDYYQLYDILSESFESVQMIGQAPFLGYAVSDLSAEEDSAISFDGSLLESDAEEIEWFIALCGETPIELDGYAIVQVPLLSAQLGGSDENAKEVERLEAENRALQKQKAQLLKEANQLEEDLRILEDEMRVHTESAKAAPSADELAQLKSELQRVKLELGTRGVRIETLENDLEKERLEAEAARARAVQLAKQYDDERKAHQASQIEQQLSKGPGPEVQAELVKLKAELTQTKANLEATEQARDEIIERTRNDAQELERLKAQVRSFQKKESEF
ncbi:MAG: methyltransferase domain-containing protein, partial [Deltaproteobacteria bacterium]|nr:methyltransferase domain-containing protein [Deltaproteobacteria bacterium]